MLTIWLANIGYSLLVATVPIIALLSLTGMTGWRQSFADRFRHSEILMFVPLHLIWKGSSLLAATAIALLVFEWAFPVFWIRHVPSTTSSNALALMFGLAAFLWLIGRRRSPSVKNDNGYTVTFEHEHSGRVSIHVSGCPNNKDFRRFVEAIVTGMSENLRRLNLKTDDLIIVASPWLWNREQQLLTDVQALLEVAVSGAKFTPFVGRLGFAEDLAVRGASIVDRIRTVWRGKRGAPGHYLFAFSRKFPGLIRPRANSQGFLIRVQ